MASCKVDELASDTKHLASVCEQLSICGPDDTAEELQSDMMNATVKSQTSGKFRRTALRFFGVRKSICILPTLFGGRNKNHNKWSSKKGISKSKTHDGLSKASYDDNLGSGYASAGNFENHSKKDTAGKSQNSSQSEFGHPNADQKSLSLPRQKKGLRSLFHSIKHHRNHRNVGLEKNEMIEMSAPLCKKEEVPVVQDKANQYVTECLGSLSEPDVPDFENIICDVTITPECIKVDAMVNSVVKQESPKSLLDDHMEGMKMVAVVSSEYEEVSRAHSESCLKLEMTPGPIMESELHTGSSDQLNLIFGDVASLKSFDSLTGCGDIIADQDDDSIAESTVSGERSRNAGKRTSCYLTYQGGGEEMASPDDLDGDSLHDFWGNKAAEEICCTCNKDHTEDLTGDLSSSHHMDLLNSNGEQQTGASDTSPSITGVLTPQSEHQESVPTSDEGYFDSTTPGPDEGQEKIDRIRTDRLPRDSYSGDALYELFAPDESLISPHYENQSERPNSEPCEYLSESGDVTDSAFAPEMNQLQIGAELYKMHQDFLSTELPRLCNQSKDLAPFTLGVQNKGLNENSNLNSKLQASVKKNNIKPEAFDEKGNILSPMEKRTTSTNADCEKRHGNISFLSTSDPDFDRFSSETFCEPKEEHLEENKPVALPYRSSNACSTISNDLDDGQTVCFSQALVDYTKHSQMLSNSHDVVDGLETNSSFAQNMQALPTIVAFDVVDMHNEGEYDEQLHMDMEEDITSPYQEFEESYLQKDAFAECDYQMLDLYEQNLFSSAWAIASLPRHLGLTRVSQSMPPLSLDRRSRSLDTESLELNIAEKYRGHRATIVSCPQTENDSKRESSLQYKKKVLLSTSEVRDSSSTMSLSWQTKSEMALNVALMDEEITEKVYRVRQTQVKHKIFSSSSSSDFPHSKSQLLSSNVSERVSCDFNSQNTELCKKQCHLALQSDSCLPHSTFDFSGIMGEDLLIRKVSTSDGGDEDIFYKTAINLQSYHQCSKGDLAVTQGMPHSGSPLNTGASKDEMDFISEARKHRDIVRPVACNKLPEATLN